MSEITTIINLTCILCELDIILVQEIQISTVDNYNTMKDEPAGHTTPAAQPSSQLIS